MASKAKARVLSIAINNEYIKLCELTKNGKSVIVHKTVTVQTPERSYSDGMIRDRGTLAKTIKVALDDNRILTSDAVFTIASTKIATKEVIIPNVKSSKIGDIIKTNATEYFPVNIEEYILQYTVLERLADDDNKIKVLVMAAPEGMIESYYDLASTLSLTVSSIDYVGNSTYQALKAQIDEVPSIVVQVENDTTIVNIFENNVLQLQRTIPYGKSVVVNAIMDTYNIRYEAALKKLQDEEVLHKTFDGDHITESLRYLVSNINRIIDYYVSRNSNKPIDKAYVIGNATTITGFTELFATELNMPLLSIETLKDVSADKKTYVDESSLPSYITNIGAIMSPVNFIPTGIEASTSKRDSSNLFKIIFAVIIVAAALLVIVPAITMMAAKTDRDTMQGNVDKIKTIEDVVNEYYDSKDKATEALLFQALTVNNDDVIANFIVSLEEVLPSDVSFKSMGVSDGSVTVSGVASSKASLALLIQQLKSIKNVATVRVGSETEAKDASGQIAVTFSLTCTFVNTNGATEAATKAAAN